MSSLRQSKSLSYGMEPFECFKSLSRKLQNFLIRSAKQLQFQQFFSVELWKYLRSFSCNMLLDDDMVMLADKASHIKRSYLRFTKKNVRWCTDCDTITCKCSFIYSFGFLVNSTVMIITMLMIIKVELAALIEIEKFNIWL